MVEIIRRIARDVMLENGPAILDGVATASGVRLSAGSHIARESLDIPARFAVAPGDKVLLLSIGARHIVLDAPERSAL